MAGTTGAAASKDSTEDPKLDVFEDDDEFEEFENEEWDGEDEGKDSVQQWEDDWDDDDVTDDFSVQLRKELESVSESWTWLGLFFIIAKLVSSVWEFEPPVMVVWVGECLGLMQ